MRSLIRAKVPKPAPRPWMTAKIRKAKKAAAKLRRLANRQVTPHISSLREQPYQTVPANETTRVWIEECFKRKQDYSKVDWKKEGF